MKTFLITLLFGCLFPVFAGAQKVISLTINGSINPASAGFVKEGIQKATDENAILLIHLNTPGGLLQSTREIVGDMLEAEIPIVVFVSPGGAHAGSAGVFITMAATVAAMAPGTNIGAAHPINSNGNNIDSIMNTKVTNDAVAFIKTICDIRGRNAEWGEKAIRNSVAITELEAVENNVVDMITQNERDLLNKLDGRTVKLYTKQVTLRTKDSAIERTEMSYVQRMLDFISDPTVAYLLLMIGFYGILFELYNPSIMVPGVVGGICLILAFYAMHSLPVNYAGIALIVFAIILFLLEIKITSYGILGIGGVIALLLGSMLLIKKVPGMEFLKISLSVIVSTTAVSAAFFLFVVGFGLKAQKLKPVTGEQRLLGAEGECVLSLLPKGTIKIEGEIWNAASLSGEVLAGEKVRVKAVNGLTLMVESASGFIS